MRVWSRLLDLIDGHGRAAMVTVAATRGSTPREAGARLIIRPDGGFTGTIGGGTLEWRAIAVAQAALARPAPRKAELRNHVLGPDMGQCCGGQVELLFEGSRPRDRDVSQRCGTRSCRPFTTAGRISEHGRLHGRSDRAPARQCVSAGDVITEGFGDDHRRLFSGRACRPRPGDGIGAAPFADLGRSSPRRLPGHMALRRLVGLAIPPRPLQRRRTELVWSRPTAISSTSRWSMARSPATASSCRPDRLEVAAARKRLAAAGILRADSRSRLSDRYPGDRIEAAGGNKAATVSAGHSRRGSTRPPTALPPAPARRPCRLNPDARHQPPPRQSGRPVGDPPSPPSNHQGFRHAPCQRRIDFAIRPGEIHALLGENGAGKSTLVKILRRPQPTSGEPPEGKPAVIPIRCPAGSARHVFQHFSLFDALTVAENIAPPSTAAPRSAHCARIFKVSAEYGSPLHPT
jgi:hypothetical protein